MAKCGDTGIKSKSTLALVSQQILDFLWRDLGTILVASTLCDNDNCLSLAELAMLF
jgi:hypothetical protein